MKRKGDLRRVLADLSHGGHAVADSAPAAKYAVRAGATPLSESYLQQSGWTPSAGVRLPNGSPVRSIADFLRFAGVL
jgi:hypothetical protein